MLWNSFYQSQCTLQSVFPVRKSTFNILKKIIYLSPSMIILCIKCNLQQLQMFRGGDLSLGLVFLRGRRKHRSKSVQSSSGHNPHLNKSFVCRFWPKQSLSRDVYSKGNIEASSDTVCSLVYHYHKSINIVERRTKMIFLLPLWFSPAQLTSLCSLWKIVWKVPQIISQLIEGRALSALCSCAFANPPTFSVSPDPQGSRRTSDSSTTQVKTMDTVMKRVQKPTQLGEELEHVGCR